MFYRSGSVSYEVTMCDVFDSSCGCHCYIVVCCCMNMLFFPSEKTTVKTVGSGYICATICSIAVPEEELSPSSEIVSSLFIYTPLFSTDLLLVLLTTNVKH